MIAVEQALARLWGRAVVALTDECRGVHPPEWSHSDQHWVCTFCRKPLSLIAAGLLGGSR